MAQPKTASMRPRDFRIFRDELRFYGRHAPWTRWLWRALRDPRMARAAWELRGDGWHYGFDELEPDYVIEEAGGA